MTSAIPPPDPERPAIRDRDGPADAGGPTRLALLREDAQLRDAVPAADRAFAAQVAMVPGFRLAAGWWDPHDLGAEAETADQLLVLRGVLRLDIRLAGQTLCDFRGPGQPLRLRDDASRSVDPTRRWTVGPEGAVIAVLGDEFDRLEHRWPELGAELRRRWADLAEDALVRAGILALSRAEERIVAVLWHLADRWGTMGPDGVTVRLPLTHSLIGRLIGARRPTVSLALSELRQEGVVHTDDRGFWAVRMSSRDVLRHARDGLAGT